MGWAGAAAPTLTAPTHPTQIDLEIKPHEWYDYPSLTADGWAKWPYAQNLERLLMARHLAKELTVIHAPFRSK